MKKIGVILLSVLIFCGFSATAHASRWDVAGKILAGLEGVRILSRGEIDILGTMGGLHRDDDKEERRVVVYEREHYPRRDHRYERCERVWVPEYAWERRWVPGHYERKGHHGRKVYVRGYYESCKVERGGHWEYRCADGCRTHHH
jgi:hypothetical protein